MNKLLVLFLSLAATAFATTRITMVRNEKVIAYEEILHPAENESGSDGFPSVTIFLSDGPVQIMDEAGKPKLVTVKRGEELFRPAKSWKLYAGSNVEVRFVRVEFCGNGSSQTWGRTGVAPDYKLPLENNYCRVTDIRFGAGTNEPLHSHHDRVVICLSGAQLRHRMPDGREEESSLKTGEVVWRKGATHIGQNVGKTDFWAITVEPK
jgi:hypothetical protein